MENINHYVFRLLRVQPRATSNTRSLLLSNLDSAIPSLEDAKRSRNNCIDCGAMRIARNMAPNKVEELGDKQYKQQRL